MAREAEVKFTSIQAAMNDFKSRNFMFEKGSSIQKINEMEIPRFDAEKDFEQQI